MRQLEWDYEQGLSNLEKHLKPSGGEAYRKFLVLEHRLKENLIDASSFGGTRELQHNRARIIEELNALTMESVDGTTFNDLCRSTSPSFFRKLFGQTQREAPTRLPRLQNGDWYMNRFVIKGFVGRGGFSDAYIAWDRVRDCEVVVKLFGTDGQPEFLRRFAEREARMAHTVPQGIPGLVATYETIPFQGGVCLIQERIPGESLHDRIGARGVIDGAEAITEAIKICETLHYLHHYKIAHCDVKPLNIIIRSPGNPTLIDLGAARFFNEQLATDDIVVSIPYSPKELMTGRPIDGRADIYSLGMTLLHAISGLPSWEQPTIVEMDTTPLPMLLPGLGSAPSDEAIRENVERSLWRIGSERLQSVIRRALAVEAGDRFSNAGEFRIALIECQTERLSPEM
jgi:serine/threonine protein kinase